MRILLYLCANYGYFLKEVIKLSYEKKLNIDWGALITSEVFVDMFKEVLDKDRIFYIHPSLNKMMKIDYFDLEVFKNYPSSIYYALSTDKGEGKFKRASKNYKLKYIYNVYLLYKDILEKFKPDFVFFPIIESCDATILYYLCKEKEIEPIIYVWARNFGVSFFTSNINEKLPFYAFEDKPTNELLEKAKIFLKEFRETDILPNYKFDFSLDDKIKFVLPSRFKKALRYFKRVILRKEPHNIADKGFIGKMITNSNFLRKIRELKKITQYGFFEIKKIEELPSNFIYFPLHVEYESSLTTYAPYFNDQLRAIDLVLQNMPSWCYLVLKEHPSWWGRRKNYFYRELKKRAGLLLAHPNLKSKELVKKAKCTISVTGTASLEAFLLAKPAIHLGETFFTDWIYKFESFKNFKDILLEAINTSVKEEKILDLIIKVFSVGRKFVLFSVGDYALNSYLVMNKKNLKEFLDAFIFHIGRIKK